METKTNIWARFLLATLTFFTVFNTFKSEKSAYARSSVTVKSVKIVQLKNKHWKTCLAVEKRGENKKYRLKTCNSSDLSQVFALRYIYYDTDNKKFSGLDGYYYELQNLWGGGYFAFVDEFKTNHRVKTMRGGNYKVETKRLLQKDQKELGGKTYARFRISELDAEGVHANSDWVIGKKKKRSENFKALAVTEPQDALKLQQVWDINKRGNQWWELIDVKPTPYAYFKAGGVVSLKMGNKCWRVKNDNALDLDVCNTEDPLMQFYIHKHGDNGNLYQIKNAHNNKCVRTSGKKLKMHDCEGRAKSDKWSLSGTSYDYISFKASQTDGKWCPRIVNNRLEIRSKTRCNGPMERFKILKK